MNQGGQLSTEYLVIVAVTIIIALVVVMVLGGFIDLGTLNADRATKAYWRTTPISLENWMILKNKTAYISLQNRHNKAILIHGFLLDGHNILEDPILLLVGRKTTLSGEVNSTNGYYDYSVEILYSRNGRNHSFKGVKNIQGNFMSVFVTTTT